MSPQNPAQQQQQPDREVSLDEFDEMVRSKYGIPQGLWKGMARQESGDDWNAKSPTGVKGKYQVTKATAAQYGLNRDDPWDQTVAAAKHLRAQYDALGSIRNDKERWLGAVGRYYAGGDAVKSDGTLSSASPDGVSNPAEHVDRVARNWAQLERGSQPQPRIEAWKSDAPQPAKRPARPESPTGPLGPRISAIPREQTDIRRPFTKQINALQQSPLDTLQQGMAQREQMLPETPELQAKRKAAEVYAQRSIPGQIYQTAKTIPGRTLTAAGQLGQRLETIGQGVAHGDVTPLTATGAQLAGGLVTGVQDVAGNVSNYLQPPGTQANPAAREAVQQQLGRFSYANAEAVKENARRAYEAAARKYLTDPDALSYDEMQALRVGQEEEARTQQTMAGNVTRAVGDALPAVAMGAAAGLRAALGTQAAMGDVERPLDTAVNMASTAVPMALTRAVRPGLNTLTQGMRPIPRAVARTAGEMGVGAAGNVGQSLVTQPLLTGKIDPNKLAEDAAIGAAFGLNDAAQSGLAERNARRPQVLPVASKISAQATPQNLDAVQPQSVPTAAPRTSGLRAAYGETKAATAGQPAGMAERTGKQPPFVVIGQDEWDSNVTPGYRRTMVKVGDVEHLVEYDSKQINANAASAMAKREIEQAGERRMQQSAARPVTRPQQAPTSADNAPVFEPRPAPSETGFETDIGTRTEAQGIQAEIADRQKQSRATSAARLRQEFDQRQPRQPQQPTIERQPLGQKTSAAAKTQTTPGQEAPQQSVNAVSDQINKSRQANDLTPDVSPTPKLLAIENPQQRRGRLVNVNGKDFELTPEQEARWKTEIDDAWASQQQRAQDWERQGDKATADKIRRGAAMRLSATKRDIVGDYTGRELQKQQARESTNYQGKPVSVDINGEKLNGKVDGNAFGRTKIVLEDGRRITVSPDQIGEPLPAQREGGFRAAQKPVNLPETQNLTGLIRRGVPPAQPMRPNMRPSNVERMPRRQYSEYEGGEVRDYYQPPAVGEYGAKPQQPPSADVLPFRRRPPAPSAPRRPLRTPGPSDRSAGFPREQRAFVRQGRAIEEARATGTEGAGPFGRFAQQAFKSTVDEGMKGQTSFYESPNVKGALGLDADASAGETRQAFKKTFARMMKVNADEVSLTQVPQWAWDAWMRRNAPRLGAEDKRRYQQTIQNAQNIEIAKAINENIQASDTQRSEQSTGSVQPDAPAARNRIAPDVRRTQSETDQPSNPRTDIAKGVSREQQRVQDNAASNKPNPDADFIHSLINDTGISRANLIKESGLTRGRLNPALEQLKQQGRIVEEGNTLRRAGEVRAEEVKTAGQDQSDQPRTITHGNPDINGKPILAQTADGKSVVANPENKSGVSVVKDQGMSKTSEPTLTEFVKQADRSDMAGPRRFYDGQQQVRRASTDELLDYLEKQGQFPADDRFARQEMVEEAAVELGHRKVDRTEIARRVSEEQFVDFATSESRNQNVQEYNQSVNRASGARRGEVAGRINRAAKRDYDERAKAARVEYRQLTNESSDRLKSLTSRGVSVVKDQATPTGELLNLTGSAKQIEWATEIRNSFIADSEKIAAKVRAGEVGYIHPNVRERFAQMILERRDALLTKQSNAAKWIDLRNTLSSTGIERVIAERIQNDEQAKAAMSAPRQRAPRQVAPESSQSSPSEATQPAQPNVGTTPSMEVQKHYHTRMGQDVWIAKVGERVDRATYDELLTKAKAAGGWYSRAFQDSPAGFAFKSEEAANNFAASRPASPIPLGETAKAHTVAPDPKSESKPRENKTPAKLRELADSLEAKASEQFGRDRQVNTARRARFAASAESQASNDQVFAKTLRNLADAIEAGETKHLSGLKNKAQAETLDMVLHRAKGKRTRQTGERYEQYKDRPANEDDIKAAEYPYPSIHKSNLKDYVEALTGVRGAKQLQAKLQRKLMAYSREDEYQVKFIGADEVADLNELIEKASPKLRIYDARALKEAPAEYNRLQAMGIRDTDALKGALVEYLNYKSGAKKADPIKEAERKLIGTKIPGYFPTPKPVIDRLLAAAEVQPGQKVLEPSAGKGSIADVIKSSVPDAKLDVIEQNSTLTSLLSAKGYQPVGSDFLEHEGQYDRIVMNPPFENGQDIDHVRHAYDQLAPGGRVVAVMSEGPFFRNDKKATEFRAWLDSTGGRSEKLPEGSFKESDRSTGVNTRMVVIEKPAGAALAQPKPVAEQSVPQSKPEHINLTEQVKSGDMPVYGESVSTYRTHENFLSEEARTTLARYEAAKKRQDSDAQRMYGKQFDQLRGRDLKAALDANPDYELAPPRYAGDYRLQLKKSQPIAEQAAPRGEVPPDVRRRVQQALDALQSASDELARARDLDKRFGGEGRYESEVFEKLQIKSSQDIVGEFQRRAVDNSVDASAVLKEMGGVPDLSLSKEGQAWRDDRKAIDAKPAQAQDAAQDESGTLTIKQANAAQRGRENASVSAPTTSVVRAAQGSETAVSVPRQRGKLPARYEVRELGDLIPSHNPFSFEPNPDYKLTNDRDYRNPANRLDVEGATKQGAFEPDIVLSDDPTATNGPPIIDSSNQVLGGNSRTMMIARTYRNNPTDAQAYRERLKAKAAQYGFDAKSVDGFDQPVLVRVLDTSAKDVQQLVTAFNVQPGKAMSTAERAAAQSRNLKPETADYLARRIDLEGESGTLLKALEGEKGIAVLNRLIQDGAIPEGDRNAMVDRGKLSESAKLQIRKLFTGRMYRDARQMETAPPLVASKLERIAPHVARLSGSDWDIAQHIPRAIDAIKEANSKNLNLDELNNQGAGLFGEAEPYSNEALAIARILQDYGVRQVEGKFRNYANAKADADKGGGMFGDVESQPDAFNRIFEASTPDIRSSGLNIAQAYRELSAWAERRRLPDDATHDRYIEKVAKTLKQYVKAAEKQGIDLDEDALLTRFERFEGQLDAARKAKDGVAYRKVQQQIAQTFSGREQAKITRDADARDTVRSPLSNLNYIGTYEKLGGRAGKAISEAFKDAQVELARNPHERSATLDNLVKTVKPYQQELRLAGKPQLANYIDAHLEAVRGGNEPFTGLANFLTKFNYYRILAYNPRSAAVNWLQPFQTLWPHLTTREFAKVMTDARKPEVRARLKEIAEKESGGHVEGMEKRRVRDLFGTVTDSNRIVGHLAGELMADKLGLTGREKARMAADWAAKVEFDNGRFGAPPLFRQPIARVMLQFKGYTAKNLERIHADWSSAPVPALATNKWQGAGTIARRSKMIASQVAVGGVRSVTGFSSIGGVLILGTLAKALSKQMPEEQADKLAESIYFGAPALLEQDLSSSMMLLDAPFGKTPSEKVVNSFGGPTLSLMVKLWQEGQNYSEAKTDEKASAALYRAAKATTPYVKTIETAASLAQGKRPTMQLGRQKVPMTALETAGYGLMGTPMRQTRFYEDQERKAAEKKARRPAMPRVGR